MEAKRECRAHPQGANSNDVSDIQQLHQENNSLKQVIAMMRKEMENVTSSSHSPDQESDNERPSHSYSFCLEQQLVQCRAYLDILLKARTASSRVSSRGEWHTSSEDDEVYFLRSRYKELHKALDEVREENLR